MVIEKIHVGTVQLNAFEVSYYQIKREDFYGIEVIERYNDRILSQSEYFTEIEALAQQLVTCCFNHLVTHTTLINIIDDFISERDAISI
ncbi:hypothetical protein CS063_09105 [Sporanaerobium hydrogeniformans]|uniref:Uncharacterized protein n=1 Tax=Sporanaerobium hydrogeniformans TaxID=3072179 RepID=A0AC61DBJ5_9FIRM|nr:DUF6514 family protein [Sporanaerobium hydrogeniformans]PHV70679.1 hypothetical protein CS063_09105 [Sporanaerobium hydrogeniformans]